MAVPSSLMTIVFGSKGSRTGVPTAVVVKSTGTRYSEFVLPMYRSVLLMPGAVTWIAFEVIGIPFPFRPIWSSGDGLQVGGRQIAVIEAAPGNVGVTEAEPAGIVVGGVDTNVRGTPDRIVLFVSSTTALIGCVLFGPTVTEVPGGGTSGTLSWIDLGGHVEKDPAELPASEIVALIPAGPGGLSRASPFLLIVTAAPGSAAFEKMPTRQLILFE